MRKLFFQSILLAVFIFGIGNVSNALAGTDKPPRPEKLEEIKSEKPSDYHSWSSGRWKWDRKLEEWQWREGSWRFDHDLYAFKNRHRLYNSYYRPYRIRYYAIPIGGGYYRIVAR